jgi:gamma-glutamyltranspeptidase/glutathione hydrolase
MVASVSEIASRVGVEVMKRGGNAIDAAVAVALALAVIWPSAGNIGGGGFMVIRRADGTAEVIDYRERAPLAASRDMYLDPDGNLIKNASTVGYRAVGVPGTIAGLALALARHGRMRWADLVEPARRLAAEGFTVSRQLARRFEAKRDLLEQFPASRRIFLRDGKLYKEGERFVQPELASVLARLKSIGPREFYEGRTARMIAADLKSGGGLVTLRDLKEYEPTVRAPLRGTYRGHEVITMPPPSSGGIALVEMLNLLEHFKLSEMGYNSNESLHVLIEAMRRAFADRAQFLGDADFVKVPTEGLTSKKYAADLVKTIDPDRATPSEQVRAGKPAGYEPQETTHFTVVDREGNVVSNTYTLNGSFGSGVTVGGAGILLNNEMDDFTAKPQAPNLYGLLQSEANAIAPRKRPLSAMTPTIVLKDGKLFFAVGSPGGPTIINTVLLIIVNVIDFKMNIQQAIDAPRLHHQWMPDQIRWEAMGISPDTRRALEKRGHVFAERPGFSSEQSGYIGDAHGIMIESESKMRLGAADPRLGGAAVGY